MATDEISFGNICSLVQPQCQTFGIYFAYDICTAVKTRVNSLTLFGSFTGVTI